MNKICFITYQFKTGGVERIFTTIAKNLDCKIALLTITNNYDSIRESIPDTVEIIPIHQIKYFKVLWLINRYIPTIPFILILISEIIYLRYNQKFKDYTYINFSDTISSIIVSFYASSSNKKYSWIHVNPKTINHSKFAFLYKYIYRKLDKIICICNEQKELLLKLVPAIQKEKIVVIYNMVDFKLISSKKNELIHYNNKFILMIARFDLRSKDFFTLIDAYHNLDLKIKDEYKLLLVGDGPDLKVVKQYVNIKEEYNHILFIGNEDNPYKWIDKAECLILSSKSEGLPTVLIEALICGTPTISTICETGPKEILNNGKCGLLVPVGNTKMLSKAISKLLIDNNLRNTIIKEGLKKAEEFHPQNILPQIKKIWNN